MTDEEKIRYLMTQVELLMDDLHQCAMDKEVCKRNLALADKRIAYWKKQVSKSRTK